MEFICVLVLTLFNFMTAVTKRNIGGGDGGGGIMNFNFVTLLQYI